MKAKLPEIKEQVTAEQAAPSDNVSLSATTKQLDGLKASFNNLPEVDPHSCCHFRTAIESGSYTINSEAIAKQMLEGTN